MVTYEGSEQQLAKRYKKFYLKMAKLTDEQQKNVLQLTGTETEIKQSRFFKYEHFPLTNLPSTLRTIETFAFSGCTNMKLDELPAELTTIGKAAFRNCQMLQLDTLPAQITEIDIRAFQGCTSLYLRHPPAWIGERAFEGCVSQRLTTLQDGSFIGVGAFYNCNNLELATPLPQRLTIMWGAFCGCTKLFEDTKLKEDILQLQRGAFKNPGDSARFN